MHTHQSLAPRKMLTALAVLTLPVLTGCATSYLIGEPPREAFNGIRAAYLTQDELGVVYTAKSNVRHDHIAWIELDDLRKGPDQAWLYPDRVERAGGALPEGAKPIPVGYGAPLLPLEADISVYGSRTGVGMHRPAVHVVVGKVGKTVDIRVAWSGHKYRPWWHYPAIPAAVALDVTTFPLQLLGGLMLASSH